MAWLLWLAKCTSFLGRLSVWGISQPHALRNVMKSPSKYPLRVSLDFVVDASSALVFLLGVSVILGWYLHLDFLKAPLSGFPVMKLNTALCFVLIGFALWSSNRKDQQAHVYPYGQVAALLVVLIALLTLAEYSFGIGLGIDQLLMREPGVVMNP